MGQKRIAYTAEESLLLTVDRGSVIAYESVDGSLKWTFSVEKANIVSVVYASTAALPSDVAAGPWRSPSSASTAVALDSAGVLHALDAVLGRELGTIEHEGEPVTLASAGDALAVAFEDRVVLYRAGAKHEIAKSASALAFSRDGLTLAIATAKGELHFVDITTREVKSFEPPIGGKISSVVPRPGGGWLVASERGLTAVYEKKNEKQLNGMVTGAAVDPAGKRLAVHRSEANVVLYDWPPTVPVGRVSATAGTIHDIAFGPDDKLGVAMAGGGAAMIDPNTYAVRRTAPRPDEGRVEWSVAAESERDRNARTEEQARRAQAHEPKSNVGARLGIGGMISLAIIVIRIFLIGARASSPSWTPPPDFGNIPRYNKTCDKDCELERLATLESECARTPRIGCTENAKAATLAFKSGECDKARELLDTIDRANKDAPGGSDALVNADVLLARIGVTATCSPTDHASYSLMRFAGASREPEIDDEIALEVRDEHEIWAASDGVLFVGTRKRSTGMCSVRRQAKRGDAWTTDITAEDCSKVAFFGRSSKEVYLNLGRVIRRFDGKEWGSPLDVEEGALSLGGTTTAGADVFVVDGDYTLLQVNPKTMTEMKAVGTDKSAHKLFGGPSLWALGESQQFLKWNGKAWSKRATKDGGTESEDLVDMWVSPGGHLFVARDSMIERSTDDGATWTEYISANPVPWFWGRSNTDVYSAGGAGTYHFDGKTWSRVNSTPAFKITGDAKDVFIVGMKNK